MSREARTHPVKGRALEHIDLVRITERTIHVSPLDRISEIDYTIFNSTAAPLSIVYVPLQRFVRNLQVYDEDGSTLNFAPNARVKEALHELESEAPDTYKFLVQRFKHAEYRLAILLRAGQVVQPGETRTFRVRYESEYPARFYSVLNWLSGNRSFFGAFFNIPRFEHEIARYPGHDYDHFNVIVGPPGYSVRGKSRVGGTRPKEGLYENGLDDSSRVTQARLPPPQGKPYTWHFVYRLLPARSSLMSVLVLFWLVGLLAGVAGVIIALAPRLAAAHEYMQVVSAGFLTAIVAIIVSYQDSWLDRFKLLAVLVAVLHVVVWLLTI